jgi:hypothetical protein
VRYVRLRRAYLGLASWARATGNVWNICVLRLTTIMHRSGDLSADATGNGSVCGFQSSWSLRNNI